MFSSRSPTALDYKPTTGRRSAWPPASTACRPTGFTRTSPVVRRCSARRSPLEGPSSATWFRPITSPIPAAALVLSAKRTCPRNCARGRAGRSCLTAWATATTTRLTMRANADPRRTVPVAGSRLARVSSSSANRVAPRSTPRRVKRPLRRATVRERASVTWQLHPGPHRRASVGAYCLKYVKADGRLTPTARSRSAAVARLRRLWRLTSSRTPRR